VISIIARGVLMFPIRCFSCGKLIGDKWEEYIKRVRAGENPEDVLDLLGIERYCCRRMFLSHVEIREVVSMRR
jgi:DNA-directed RNA polymerase subunit N